MTPEQARALRADFPAHLISKLPKPMKKREEMDQIPKGECKVCGGYHAIKSIVHLDYVGHAVITDRLLSVDPEWSWKPMVRDDRGFPMLDQAGGLWIELTVCGVTRLGYGDADGKTGGNAVKERIGDALRNAAMRFGVGLDMWSKVELHPDGWDELKGSRVIEPEPEAKSISGSTGTPMADTVVRGWTVEAQEQFAILKDQLYTTFKVAGKMDKHPAEAEKWQKRMVNDEASAVISGLTAHIAKLVLAFAPKGGEVLPALGVNPDDKIHRDAA